MKTQQPVKEIASSQMKPEPLPLPQPEASAEEGAKMKPEPKLQEVVEELVPLPQPEAATQQAVQSTEDSKSLPLPQPEAATQQAVQSTEDSTSLPLPEREAVMWGIVGELKRHFGSTWPEEAVVLDFSQTERLDLVSLQGCPKLIVVLLYTADHQALMVIRACEWEALLLDGKWDSDLERAADRACKGVMKAYRRMYPKLDLYMRTMLPSGLPAQQDNWSCGHRMVLLLAALLDDGLADEFNSGWASPITSFKIHPAVVSDEELHHLCGADVGAKEDPVTLASRSKQEKRFKTEPVAFPTKKPVVQSAEEHGSPCVQKRAASPKLKRKLEEDPVDPKAADFESALVAMAEQAIEERESKKEARAKAAFSKSVIKACGLTFNSFQVRHLKMFPRGLPKRHWNDFLFGIAGDSDVTCRVCMGLVEEFNVGAAKDQAMQERENNIRRAAPER
ncbi:Myeloid leukemia factor, partial [Durusdinium trenchii]